MFPDGYTPEYDDDEDELEELRRRLRNLEHRFQEHLDYYHPEE